MKITDLNSAGVGSVSSGAITTSGIGAYGPSGRGSYGPGSDRVQLSGASRLASSALAAHASRLSQLKSLVASGNYNPSGETVGKAIISEALSRSS
jgi:hypothetical protein